MTSAQDVLAISGSIVRAEAKNVAKKSSNIVLQMMRSR
jgi:hypothetical protein